MTLGLVDRSNGADTLAATKTQPHGGGGGGGGGETEAAAAEVEEEAAAPLVYTFTKVIILAL